MSLEPLDRLLRPPVPPPELRSRVLGAAEAAAREAEYAEVERSRKTRQLELAWRFAMALSLLGHLWVSFDSERFQTTVKERFAATNFHFVSESFALEAER